MSDSKSLLLCYNKGCGKNYHPEENTEGSCCHHPGEPVFHDAYKGWSCCSKKCTDFTEFLNIKGCTLSIHSNIKPPEPEKPKQNDRDINEVVIVNPPIPKKEAVLKRSDENAPMERLPFMVANSLQQLILNKKTQTLNVVDGDELAVGTVCKNSGCRKTYEGEASNSETCIYHDGVPIFHEGLKYWTCCIRKTTDFDSFLDQAGCRTGCHVWIKKEDSAKKIACRTDWHQTESFVYISVYAKGCDYEKSFVESNPVKVLMNLSFDGDVFQEEIILCGVIDVKQSSVNFAATKVEIKLKKGDASVWKTLSFDSNKLKT